MRLLLTASVIIVGLALKPAPAAAGRDDVVGVIAGLIALGVVAAAINDAQSSPAQPVKPKSVARKPAKDPLGDLRPLSRADHFGGPKGRYVLPRRCLARYQSSDGRTPALGKRCLQRHYPRVAELPARCERRARTEKGPRVVYAPQCLRRAGYRVEARDD